MKRILLGLFVAAFACLMMCSCVNINSFNKVKPPVDAGQDDEGNCSVKTEIYFGLVKPDGTTISEAEWQAFVDKSISPLFPDGFTVVDAFGQCKDDKGRIIKGKTKMLIVVQPKYNEASIDRMKEEFNKTFPDNPLFNVSYQVLSPLDKELECDVDEDGDDD